MNPLFNKSVLDGGIRLVTEQVDGAASAALGIWVAAGSRDEESTENGLAHLIEHMAFKGTARRDKLAIAREMDRQGGLANAFTTREHTCYHTRVRPEHLPEAVDLLMDIFHHSLYDEAELALEKAVIQQEIAMVEDEPEELVHDLASEFHWPDHPLGRPVAGTRASVRALDRDIMLGWMRRNYSADRIVVSAAGRVDHQRLGELVASRLTGGLDSVPRRLAPPVMRPGILVRRRRLEQAHLVVAAAFPDQTDPRRRAAAVLNAALGGNMASRLFQEIREKRGLAYSIYSNYSAYSDIGLLEIYAGAPPGRIGETRRLIEAELDRLRREPLPETELTEAVGSLKTGLILSGDSADSRMNRLAKNEFSFGRRIDLAEICGELDRVTADDVRGLAEKFLPDAKLARCVLGPVNKKDV